MSTIYGVLLSSIYPEAEAADNDPTRNLFAGCPIPVIPLDFEANGAKEAEKLLFVLALG